MREVAEISADNRAARLNATTVEETAGRARTLAGFVARAEEGGDGAGAEDMAGIGDMAGRLVEMAQMGAGEAEEILSVSRRLEKLLAKSKSALAAIEKAEAEGGCFLSLGIPARAARARVTAARDVVAVVEANTAAAVDAKAVAGKTLTAAKEIKSRVAEVAKKMGEEKSGCNCQKKEEEEEEEMVKAVALEAIKKKMAEFGWL